MSRKSRTIFFFYQVICINDSLTITFILRFIFSKITRGIEMITNRAITPPHLPRIDPSFYASFNLTHKKSTDNFVPPSAQKRYPPRSFLSFVQLLPLPSRKIKERKKEKKGKRDNKKKIKKEGREEIKGRKTCVNGVHSMSKTSPPVFHPRGRWRGQDRKHRPAERIFFSAPRNSSRALLHVTPAIYYTHVYIYIYFPSVLACTMAVFHRYLSHSGTGCTAPAFTIGF